MSDPQWLIRLYFLTDVTRHLNIQNLKLQGRNKSIAELFKEVLVFRLKLDMWIEQMATGECTHFPLLNCPELNGITDFEELQSYLVEMKSQFRRGSQILMSVNHALISCSCFWCANLRTCLSYQASAQSVWLSFKRN